MFIVYLFAVLGIGFMIVMFLGMTAKIRELEEKVNSKTLEKRMDDLELDIRMERAALGALETKVKVIDETFDDKHFDLIDQKIRNVNTEIFNLRTVVNDMIMKQVVVPQNPIVYPSVSLEPYYKIPCTSDEPIPAPEYDPKDVAFKAEEGGM